jgi:hypothetical protein
MLVEQLIHSQGQDAAAASLRRKSGEVPENFSAKFCGALERDSSSRCASLIAKPVRQML